MGKLNRNDSLALFRAFVHAHRELSHAALDITRASIRNDRQFSQVERTIRSKERESREYILVVLQQLNLVDDSVLTEDLKHMR